MGGVFKKRRYDQQCSNTPEREKEKEMETSGIWTFLSPRPTPSSPLDQSGSLPTPLARLSFLSVGCLVGAWWMVVPAVVRLGDPLPTLQGPGPCFGWLR